MHVNTIATTNSRIPVYNDVDVRQLRTVPRTRTAECAPLAGHLRSTSRKTSSSVRADASAILTSSAASDRDVALPTGRVRSGRVAKLDVYGRTSERRRGDDIRLRTLATTPSFARKNTAAPPGHSRRRAHAICMHPRITAEQSAEAARRANRQAWSRLQLPQRHRQQQPRRRPAGPQTFLCIITSPAAVWRQ